MNKDYERLQEEQMASLKDWEVKLKERIVTQKTELAELETYKHKISSLERRIQNDCDSLKECQAGIAKIKEATWEPYCRHLRLIIIKFLEGKEHKDQITSFYSIYNRRHPKKFFVTNLSIPERETELREFLLNLLAEHTDIKTLKFDSRTEPSDRWGHTHDFWVVINETRLSLFESTCEGGGYTYYS